MRFEIVTVFPEVAQHARVGLLARALDSGQIEVDAISPRDFTADKHRSTDDAPYGGGSGMLMMPGPVVDAMEHLDAQQGTTAHRVLLTPQGERFTQAIAQRLSALPRLTLVCGRYEGFDERIRDYVHEELSLGDFVLLGGEVAALTIIEATARLIPGVLGNADSAVDESHQAGLLEYPQYTRPAEFRGAAVPEVLTSGNHAAIAAWRRREALRRTLERRPDMLDLAPLSEEDRAYLAQLREPNGRAKP